MELIILEMGVEWQQLKEKLVEKYNEHNCN